jgi:hypothetical protein
MFCCYVALMHPRIRTHTGRRTHTHKHTMSGCCDLRNTHTHTHTHTHVHARARAHTQTYTTCVPARARRRSSDPRCRQIGLMTRFLPAVSVQMHMDTYRFIYTDSRSCKYTDAYEYVYIYLHIYTYIYIYRWHAGAKWQ